MAQPRDLEITKTTGERERFDARKLRHSLRRAGASARDQDRVLDEVQRQIVPGTPTRKLHRIAMRILRQSPTASAARYSLQRAILELGPSGFPFEHFLAALLQREGWHTRIGVKLKGRFVAHEVDVDARRDERRVLAECKFRQDPNGKVDVKTALYVYGRATDLRSTAGGYDEYWIATNGRFTEDARRFGEGMGLYLLSWNHPKGQGLRERIDRAGLHPITCLTHLRKAEKEALLREGLVVVADLHDQPGELRRLRLTDHRLHQVRAEIDGLCGA